MNLDESQTLADYSFGREKQSDCFSENEKSESVSIDLGALVPYGPTLGPTRLGQSFKIRAEKVSGPYILPNNKIFDLENENSPSK